jgi:hypothetical protein
MFYRASVRTVSREVLAWMPCGEPCGCHVEDIRELESTAGKYGGKYGDHYVCTAGPDPASRLVTYSKSDQWLVTSGQPQAKKI